MASALLGGGSDEPEKPKMSQLEKTQHAVSAAEWDHYKQTYQPIEREYLRDAQRDYSERAKGQATSGAARQSTDNLRLAALGGGVSRAASGMAGATTAGRSAAMMAERGERDARIAGALGVGRELATDTTRNLGHLGRIGAQGAIADMENKLAVDTARSAARAQMLGSVGGAALGSSMSTGAQGAGTSAPAARGATRADYESLMTNAGSRQMDYRAMMR